MGDSKVTKRCVKCGAVMHNVSAARKYCDFCRFGLCNQRPDIAFGTSEVHWADSAGNHERGFSMQNIVKNTDCTNHIKELWKVFTKEGKELFSYTIRGEGEDEEECTKQLLAYENHCYPNQIHVHTEMR